MLSKNQKAFTLIELLVVISIIGLLSSIVLVSTKGVREKARLAKAQKFDSSIQHALGANAVGIWRFEEGTGTTAHDESGYGNDGTIYGATFVSADDLYPNTNALSFDGVNDYVQFPYDADSQPNSITIEYWIKLIFDPNTSSSNNWRWIFSPTGWTNPCQLILEQNRTTCFTVYTSGGSSRYIDGIFSSEKLTVGKWAHLVYIYDAFTGNGYAYKDGELSRGGTMVSGGGNLNNSSNGWRISWPSGTPTPSGSGTIPGIIDDVRIYDTALNATEIQQHYAEGARKYGIAEK